VASPLRSRQNDPPLLCTGTISSSFILIATGKIFAIEMPFSKMKAEKRKGSAREEGGMAGCSLHVYSENTCIWPNSLSEIHSSVLTLMYIYNSRDIKNDLEESKLMTWPLVSRFFNNSVPSIKSQA